MIFDSWFDPYRGVIILVRILDGKLNKGDKVKFLSNKRSMRSMNWAFILPRQSR